jgi:hypothetical protein
VSIANIEAIEAAWQAAEASTVESTTQNNWRNINGCAYFVLLFAQLETALDRFYEEIAGFDSNLASPFQSRVDLLRDYMPPELITRVYSDYDLRCDIAHDRVIKANLDIAEIASAYRSIIEAIP